MLSQDVQKKKETVTIRVINQKSQKKPGMQTDSQEKHWKYIITGTRRFQKILTSLIRKRIVTQ